MELYQGKALWVHRCFSCKGSEVSDLVRGVDTLGHLVLESYLLQAQEESSVVIRLQDGSEIHLLRGW